MTMRSSTALGIAALMLMGAARSGSAQDTIDRVKKLLAP